MSPSAVLASARHAAERAAEGQDLGGITGWAADVISALGWLGVGLITLLETVLPPVPSEVVLPLAGYLAGRGEVSLPAIIASSTAGSLLGALFFYALAARVGMERARRAVGRIPLMKAEDVDRAGDWFRRHGRMAVFTGRLIPGVRSLISLPAGATRMPLGTFCLFTVLGSAIWNSLLIMAGVALSSRWREVERYSGLVDLVVLGALVVLVGLGAVRRVRERRAAGRSAAGGSDGAAPPDADAGARGPGPAGGLSPRSGAPESRGREGGEAAPGGDGQEAARTSTGQGDPPAT